MNTLITTPLKDLFYTLPDIKQFPDVRELTRKRHFEKPFTFTFTSSLFTVDPRFLRQQQLMKVQMDLLQLQKRKIGWDSYAGCPSEKKALANALSTLIVLSKQDIIPDRVAAVDDGGILMEYVIQGSCFYWEFEEDGDIGLLVCHPDSTESVFDMTRDSIDAVVKRVHHG